MGALQMDNDKKKNPGGRKCYKCGSTDHLKNKCPKKKAEGSQKKNNNKNKKSEGKAENCWMSKNKENKTTMKRDGTKRATI